MELNFLARLAVSLAIIAAGFLTFKAVTLLNLKKVSNNSPWLKTGKAGKKTILYFTTPDCVHCRTTQRPALSRLQELLGDEVDVVEVNAYENHQMAKEWGVLSIPTIFILNKNGTPLLVNYGVTSAEKLYNQLQNV